MNDRNRWSGERDERGREQYGNRQQGGWGDNASSREPFYSQSHQSESGRDQSYGQSSHGPSGYGQNYGQSHQGQSYQGQSGYSPSGYGQSGYGQWDREQSRNGPSGQEQSYQGQNWGEQGRSHQQGAWHDDRHSGDYRGNEWRGSRDWGDAQPQQRQWSDESRSGSGGGREASQPWAERAWGGSSLREGDRSFSGGSGDRESYRRDNRYQPGSQSFASDYGMRDGPNYDRSDRTGGSSNPTYGRGYGPDYGRDEGRGFFERAGDEIASWFGSEDAERRREQDYRGESHRGRGPGDYTRSDERIREDVNDRLTDDHRVDARRISVTVDKGEVTLSGTVGDRDTKRRAEDLAERISGVKHVQNNLRVDRQGSQDRGAYGQQSGGSQYTGQSTMAGGSSHQSASESGPPVSGEWNSGGARMGTTETGVPGAGRPDASAGASPSGSAARSDGTAATTGDAGTGRSGASTTASGSSGASGTGASTGGTATGASTSTKST